MTGKPDIQNGVRLQLEICGEMVTAGFNVVLGQPQLAYVPKTNRHPAMGTELEVDGKTYQVTNVRRSTFMVRMVVLDLKEVTGG